MSFLVNRAVTEGKKRKKKGMAVQDKATGLYKFLLVLTVHLG